MKLKYLSWIPAVLLMVIIFAFSAKPADASNESSLTITERILPVLENMTGHAYIGTERTEMINKINHIVRKGAHFTEYALLACTFILHLLVLKMKKRWVFSIPVILSAIYAVSDELHQIFIPGRSCMLSDMLLDTCGAATGTLLFLAFYSLHRRRVKLK